jgi:nitroreductase
LDFYEVVNNRRSKREFQSRPVEEEKLFRVLEAGLKAPSNNHLRQWEFILIKDAEQRRKVAELAQMGKSVENEVKLEKTLNRFRDPIQKEMYRKAIPVQVKMLVSAPELLLVCYRLRKPLRECEILYDLNDLASVWMCIENILLAMTAEGLYGVTAVPRETTSLKKMLGIPEGYEVAAAIPIGYPEDYSVKQKTVFLMEKLHYNYWEIPECLHTCAR